jgi:DNA processing protein
MNVNHSKSEIKELEAAIRLSRLPGVGAARFVKLINHFIFPTDALKSGETQRILPKNHQSIIKSPTQDKIATTISKLENGEINGTYYSHSSYPNPLCDLSEPPPVLFYSGCRRKKWPVFAAVVGTRKADSDAGKAVSAIVKELSSCGYAILSGGARGIDTLAHQAALENKVETFCVIASGLDVNYPEENSALFRQIETRKGALLTEFLCQTRPHRSFFPTRNRLIAALAQTVVVVQAPEKSGALITASWAKKLGRRLLVLKPLNQSKNWQGNLALIESGTEIISL